jgi:hypothetical protein
LELDLPAKLRVDALLRDEFFGERALRRLACYFAEHTLHIYAAREPYEDSVRRCLAAAQRYAATAAGMDELQAAVKEAVPVVWRLADTPFVGAFEAGMVVTFLDYKDAAELARIVAAHTQRAAHRQAWESRQSDVEPMTAREEEACWQLRQIIRALVAAQLLGSNYSATRLDGDRK